MLADDYKEKARALAKRCATRALEVERLFTECHDKLAMLAYAQKSQLDGGTFSEMRDGNAVKRKAQAILRDLYSRVYQVIRDGNEAEWDNANKASDALVESVLSDMGLERDNFQRYFARPKQAVDSFGGSFKGGGGLSERVWDVCRDDFAQCESAIAVAMGAGNSAASVSRDVRKYLKNPDALFRRVRDSEGKLHLSKRAAAFHPGSGVYRSAYKNAMRMTRTENNAAYRNADCERWRRLDFVLGYEVRTSNNHPESDICDALKGAYPKSFNFTGWHPQCRCHAVPILASRDEMRRVAEANLDGREYKSPNEVKANANFEKWCAENKGRIDGWRANGKEPWFLMNNKEAVDKALKTKTAKTAKQVADERHAARTPQMVEEIRGQWAERKAVRKYGNAMLSYMGGIKDVTEIDKLRDAMKHPNSEAILEQCKVLKKIGKTILSLDKLADPMKTAKEFSMLEAISVNAAVKKKLAAMKGLSLDEQIGKLKNEIQYVEDKKKKTTWKVAQDAYKKQLAKVEEERGKAGIKAGNSKIQTGHRKDVRSKDQRIKAVMEDTGVSMDKARDFEKAVEAFSYQYDYEIRRWQSGKKLGKSKYGHTEKDIIEKEQTLEEFINKSPKWHGGTTYRGLSLSEKELAKLMDDIKAGKGDMLGTSSWSTSFLEADKFSRSNIGKKSEAFGDKKTKMVVLESEEQPLGTSIMHLSYYKSEYEVAVSKECRYKLVSAIDFDGVLHIKVKPVK